MRGIVHNLRRSVISTLPTFSDEMRKTEPDENKVWYGVVPPLLLVGLHHVGRGRVRNILNLLFN